MSFDEMRRSVKVDFFSFTTRRSLSELCTIFAYLPNPLEMKERGLYGYTFSMVSPDGVSLLFSPGRNDIHVQISGRGCDVGLVQLCDLLSDKDTVTRLDVAVDCIGSGFTCSEIWGYLQQGSFVSVSSSIRQVEGILSRRSERQTRHGQTLIGRLPQGRLNSGHTIYIGASTSDRMVRIYDKGAESETGADWLRFEIQLRRESANQFFLCGVNGKTQEQFEESAFGMLNKQIRIVESGQDKLIEQRNYNLLKLLPFWEKLTSAIGPIKLQIPKPLKTLRSTMRYVKNTGGAFKMLQGAMTDFAEWFEGVVEDAELKPHHKVLQDDFLSATGFGDTQSDSYYHFLKYQSCGV